MASTITELPIMRMVVITSGYRFKRKSHRSTFDSDAKNNNGLYIRLMVAAIGWDLFYASRVKPRRYEDITSGSPGMLLKI